MMGPGRESVFQSKSSWFSVGGLSVKGHPGCCIEIGLLGSRAEVSVF